MAQTADKLANIHVIQPKSLNNRLYTCELNK